MINFGLVSSRFLLGLILLTLLVSWVSLIFVSWVVYDMVVDLLCVIRLGVVLVDLIR